MRSWQTSLGGAFSALGKSLMGVGIVPQLAGNHSTTLTYIATAGFILDAIGGFFAHLFAADQSVVIKMIEKSGGDTSMFSQAKGGTMPEQNAETPTKP